MVSTAIAGTHIQTGRQMIICVLFLLTAGSEAFCQDPGRGAHKQDAGKTERLISLSGDNLSLHTIKREILRQTGINIGSNDLLDREEGFSVHLRNVGIDSCLRALLEDTGLGYTQYTPTTFVIYRQSDKGTATRHPLHGSVHNMNGEPLEAASVTIGGGRGALTNKQGLFCIADTARPYSLQVSFTGYLPFQIMIANRHFLDIVLERDDHSLDAVIIEAYGRTTSRYKTGAIEKLSSEDIAEQPVGNVLAALEGRMTGLAVNQGNGVPGSSFNVQVRGQNSILNGNTPLILVDGVPIPPNNNSLSYIPSGSALGLPGMSPLGSFNPADIESVEVLKDAEATAIYGSRGANGVILITTKKSKPDSLRISAGLSFGVSRPVNLPHLMNSAQYRTMRAEAIHNDGDSLDNNSAPDLVLWDPTRYTDMEKMAIGNKALFEDVRIAVSGGDTIFNYLVSENAHAESTPFPGSRGDRRLSAFAALGYHSRNKKLQVQNSTMYSTVDNRLPVYDPTQFIYLAPNAPSPYDANGKFVWQSDSLSFLNIPAQRLNTYHGFTKNFFSHADIAYALSKQLGFRTSLGYNSVATAETSVEPIAAQDPASFPTGSYFGGTTWFSGWIAEPQLEYVREKGRAHWDLLMGATWEGQHSRHSAVTAQGFSDDADLGMLDKAQVLYNQDSSVLYLYEAIFLRAKLNLADKYLFSVSGRRDGSSRFGPGHQFGNFGSVGAAWLFLKESFFPNIPLLSFGKLRGSYGVTGNDQIGDYQYLQSWSRSVTNPYGGVQGVFPATTDNPKLGWELVHKLEGALELGAFRDHLFLSAAWYRDWSGNQLMYDPLPVQTGYQGVTANLPVVVENTGWEFVLRMQEPLSRKLSWSSSFSLTIPRNRLKAFPGLAASGYAGVLSVGKSVNTINTLQYIGVDRDSGLYRFRDLNHDGVLDARDQVFGGNTDPRAYGGWNNEFSYKGWQLTVFVEGRRQQGLDPLLQIFRVRAPGSLVPGLLGNMPVEALRRWQQPGDNQPLQQFTSGPPTAAANALGYYVHSDAELRDASFIRVKNVTISYAFPAMALSRWHLRSCRVYLQGQNLLTITHYPVTDPETQNPNALPPLRTLAAGIQFNL